MARFEINLAVRDAKGNLTGQRKSFRTNNANELSIFWQQNQRFKKHKKKDKNNKLPTAKQADELLGAAHKYAQKIRDKKNKQLTSITKTDQQ